MSPAHEVALERIPQQSCKVRTRPEKSAGLPSEISAPPRRDHCGPNGPAWFSDRRLARRSALSQSSLSQSFQPSSGTPDGPRTHTTLAQMNPRTDTSHQDAKNGRGMWPQYGVTPPPAQFPVPRARCDAAGPRPPRACVRLSRSPRFFGRGSVDRGYAASLYKPSRHAVRLSGAMTRLRSTSLIFGDQASDFRSEA